MYREAVCDTCLACVQMYPAPIRSTAHGISAATGKVGSISVVVWLNYLGNRNKFWITWPFALAGAVCCWVFIADNTGLDLAEQVILNPDGFDNFLIVLELTTVM